MSKVDLKKQWSRIKNIAKTAEFLATFIALFVFLFVIDLGKVVAFVAPLLSYLIVNGVRFWAEKPIKNRLSTVDGTKPGGGKT